MSNIDLLIDKIVERASDNYELTVEYLIKSTKDYVKWCHENPFILETHKRTLTNNENGELESLTQQRTKKVRPYTLSGLSLFLGITEAEFLNLTARNDKIGFITRQIMNMLNENKLAGGASGAFNSNIIRAVQRYEHNQLELPLVKEESAVVIEEDIDDNEASRRYLEYINN